MHDVQVEVEAADWVREMVVMLELLRRKLFFLVLLRREAVSLTLLSPPPVEVLDNLLVAEHVVVPSVAVFSASGHLTLPPPNLQ